MKARHGWGTTAQRTLITFGAVATLCASTAAWADGGTIRFVGALVAPSFDVGVVGGAAASPSKSMEGLQAYDASTGITRIAFWGDPSAAPHARVSVLAADNIDVGSVARIQAGFTDGAGRRVSADADGRYPVGASGGVLTLAPKQPGNAAGASMATVMVDYR